MEGNLTIQDIVAMQEAKNDTHRNSGLNTIAWVIGIVVVLALIMWLTTSISGARAAIVGNIGAINGQLNCLTPKVERLDGIVYGNSVSIGNILGTNNTRDAYQTAQLNALNTTVYGLGCPSTPYVGRGGCGEGNGRNRFAMNQTFRQAEPATVTVSESCVN